MTFRILDRKKEASFKARKRYFDSHYSNLPTLDDIREATASTTNDIVKQILSGQAVYYGYEVEWEPDNHIPAKNSSNTRYDKIVETAKASYERRYAKVKAEKARKSLDQQINDLFGGTLTAEQLAEKKKALGL